MSPAKLLAASMVIPAADSDVLRFSVSDAHSRNAIVLANTYAREFTFYKTKRDVAAVKSALRSLTARIETLQTNGAATAPLYSMLIQQRAQLKTVVRLLSAQTSVLQPAEHASAFRTHVVRDGVLGGVLGGLLGIGLVAVAAVWLSRKPR